MSFPQEGQRSEPVSPGEKTFPQCPHFSPLTAGVEHLGHLSGTPGLSRL